VKERIAILGGVRTPFMSTGGAFEAFPAADLGRLCVTEALERLGIPVNRVGSLTVGSVTQTAGAVHVARNIALSAGLSENTATATFNSGGVSGLVSLISAARSLALGEVEFAAAAGAESMSSIPVLISGELRSVAQQTSLWKQARSLSRSLPGFRPSRLLSGAALARGFTDPTCGLTLGETAEVLVREFGIDRESQDEYALLSHRRAGEALAAGRLADETISVLIPPAYETWASLDDGIQADLNLQNLLALKPAFDRLYGSVTSGNSAGGADGAAAIVLAAESAVEGTGVTPLGFLRDYEVGGVPAEWMGLGSARAVSSLLEKSGTGMDEIGLVEIHEAYAAQVIANERVFEDDRWSDRVTGRKAVGHLDRSILNVNGGALALGHPPGASGLRMVLSLLHEMRRRGVRLGVAAISAGGGQGAAVLLEGE